MMRHDWEAFEHNGRRFARRTERDDDHGAPWEECDGHGPVSEWTSRDKRPGEMTLCEDRGRRRYYDFREACKIARADGRDAPPYREGTKRQRAARAALADYEYLRRWCNDVWCYVGVIVAPVCPCCGDVNESESQSVWGIESDSAEYLIEVSQELAEEIEPAVCEDECEEESTDA
jgi:hypothetical protein